MNQSSNPREPGNRNSSNEDNLTGKGVGPQGVDKAPGEETAESVKPVKQEAQLGKKDDADPSKESGRPATQKDI